MKDEKTKKVENLMNEGLGDLISIKVCQLLKEKDLLYFQSLVEIAIEDLIGGDNYRRINKIFSKDLSGGEDEIKKDLHKDYETN